VWLTVDMRPAVDDRLQSVSTAGDTEALVARTRRDVVPATSTS